MDYRPIIESRHAKREAAFLFAPPKRSCQSFTSLQGGTDGPCLRPVGDRTFTVDTLRGPIRRTDLHRRQRQAVRRVQEWLNLHGRGVVVDGIFGPATAGAVRTFQGRNGLSGTGVVDEATLDRRRIVGD